MPQVSWLRVMLSSQKAGKELGMQNDPEKASLLAHLLADRRYAAMLGLGFSAGIPYLLVYVTTTAFSHDQDPTRTHGFRTKG
jgi:hypothetical protein